MAKLISSRLYLDYNATSPLSTSVKKLLKGDSLFANPSSAHSSGKASNKQVRESISYITDLFGLTVSHQLFFHSGATEGMNTVIKGTASSEYFCSVADHPCSYNLLPNTKTFDVGQNGEFDEEKLIADIKNYSGKAILNYLYVHNETGVVWDLDIARRIKERTGCLVHVDATQAPGKIKNWNVLDPDLDFYTFSAHKFGALKGVGFTFYKNDSKFAPLFHGGGQQNGVRPGTLNVPGICSCREALIDLQDEYDADKSLDGKEFFEKSLKGLLKSKLIIVGEGASFRNTNTIYMIIDGKKSDIVSATLDMAGIEVSSGSACASGSVEPSRTLLAMGYSEENAKEAIRISFEPSFNLKKAKKYFEKMRPTLSKFL